MTLVGVLLFVPSILTGSLIVHLVWPERRISALIMKLSLGIGLGLGLNSILHFLSLVVGNGKVNLLAVHGGVSVLLFILIVRKENRIPWFFELSRLTYLQMVLLGIFLAVMILLLMMTNNIYLSRPQGAFDAWSIWNRAARFIYRDPENWQATLSPEIYWRSHPEYPLLVPMNIAWGWSVLDVENQRIPMVQGLLFSVASVGILFASLAFLRTIGQGVLASMILVATPAFIATGSAQISDVPVMYFILASSVMLYLYCSMRSEEALLLSGVMAGFAGWAKNEGSLFIAVCSIVVLLTCRKKNMHLLWYVAGLLLPMLVLLYFKSIAPTSDLFSGGNGALMNRVTDFSRYGTIVKTLFWGIIGFGSDVFPALVVLLGYAILMRKRFSVFPSIAANSVAAVVILQLLGYCAIYVLTPHDLEWHLFTSLDRLILHIYPTSLFLVFGIISSPEEIFKKR